METPGVRRTPAAAALAAASRVSCSRSNLEFLGLETIGMLVEGRVEVTFRGRPGVITAVRLAGSLPATKICLKMRWRKTPGRLVLSAPTDLRYGLLPRCPAKAAS
jgi:hypothetical protein